MTLEWMGMRTDVKGNLFINKTWKRGPCQIVSGWGVIKGICSIWKKTPPNIAFGGTDGKTGLCHPFRIMG